MRFNVPQDVTRDIILNEVVPTFDYKPYYGFCGHSLKWRALCDYLFLEHKSTCSTNDKNIIVEQLNDLVERIASSSPGRKVLTFCKPVKFKYGKDLKIQGTMDVLYMAEYLTEEELMIKDIIE